MPKLCKYACAGLMDAITKVTWPITHEYSEDSRYNTLLQISVGQEEVDEVIGRDINRTFPEHPQFGFEQGQQALYRVLKAYSLHDLEVRPALKRYMPAEQIYQVLLHRVNLMVFLTCPFMI